MKQRRWWRLALALPILLAGGFGSQAAWAQAADTASVEELQEIIARQQLQINQQQQLLQVQSIVLDGLQQQVVKARKAEARRAARERKRGRRVGRRGLIRLHP